MGFIAGGNPSYGCVPPLAPQMAMIGVTSISSRRRRGHDVNNLLADCFDGYVVVAAMMGPPRAPRRGLTADEDCEWTTTFTSRVTT
jgi:hypothetical protein